MIKIKITKPLYETSDYYAVGIYDRRIKDAIRLGSLIEIETQGKRKVFSPKFIKDKCQQIEKVYLLPEKPMKEYIVYIPKKEENSKEDEIEDLAKKGIFG
ncbi:MAG TPA: hypothetical protein PKV21_07685 [bacterium]|nr:hypothetical protein [bacterium]